MLKNQGLKPFWDSSLLKDPYTLGQEFADVIEEY